MAVYFPLWLQFLPNTAMCKYGIAYDRDVKMLSLHVLLFRCGALTVKGCRIF